MNTKSRVRIGQIGCGYWGSNLLRNAIENPRAELIAVCDTNLTACQKMISRHPGIARYSSFEEMLARSPIDAVIIATPSGLHFKHALLALETGKHVLVEKPLATSSADAERLIAAAEARQRILMVGHTFLYNNIVREVKNRIDSGELGNIYYAYSQRVNLGQFRHDTDVLWTLAPHDISIMNYLFSSRPNQVSARGLTYIRKESGISEVCFAHLEYPDGRSAHLHMSWVDPQKKREIIIIGSNKMLIYDDMDTDRHIQIYDKRVEREYRKPFDNFADFSTKLRAGDLVIPNIKLVEPLYVEIDTFIDCVQSGAAPLTDGWHALEVINILESLTASMQNGCCPVSVKYHQPDVERKGAVV